MSNENGGPAFPSKKRIFRAGYPTEEFAEIEGMTLRDYFAAKAMQVNLNALGGAKWNSEEECAEEIARMSYKMADAMLMARK